MQIDFSKNYEGTSLAIYKRFESFKGVPTIKVHQT